MRPSARIALVLLLEVLLLAACRGDETPLPTPTPTATRTLIPSATLPPPTATDTPYPSETPTSRAPTNTLSATLTQTWPQTPTRTPAPTRTPSITPTNLPTPTITGTPPTVTPTFTLTPSSSQTATPTLTPTNTGTPEPMLWINPPTRTISAVGGSGQVLLYLSNMAGVYSLDVRLSYNYNLFTVQDANITATGIQVLPGTCPQPEYVSMNGVDPVQGLIDYTVTQLGATPGCGDGIVFSVTFECLASGNSPLDIDYSQILDRNAQEIEHTLQAGTLICQP